MKIIKMKIVLLMIGLVLYVECIVCNNTCTPSHIEEMPIMCDESNPCFSSNCNWHNFQCRNETCSNYNLADGICDENCNSELTSFDGLDCDDASISEVYILADQESTTPNHNSSQIYLSFSSALNQAAQYLRVYLSKGSHFLKESFKYSEENKLIRLSPWMCDKMLYDGCFESESEFIEERPEIKIALNVGIDTGSWSGLILDYITIESFEASMEEIQPMESLIIIGEYSRLTLNNVVIMNISTPYHSIIRFESSSYVYIRNTIFFKIFTQNEDSEGVVIYSNSTIYSTAGEFTYEGGQILYINDEKTLNQKPIISISNFREVSISNSLLQYNKSSATLISLNSVSTARLSNNTYSYNLSPFIISSNNSNLYIDSSSSIENSGDDLEMTESSLNLGSSTSSSIYSDIVSPSYLVYYIDNSTYSYSNSPIPGKFPTYKDVNLRFDILDRLFMRMSTDSTSIGTLNIYNLNTTERIANIRIPAYEGYYSFRLPITAKPLDELLLIVTSSLKDANTSKPLRFIGSIKVEDCKMGEQLVDDGCRPCDIAFYNTVAGDRCVPCDENAICRGGEELPMCRKGYYSYKGEYACRECEENLECPGGDVNYPVKGYWRDSMHGEIYPCLLKNACLGGIETESETGTCEVGYGDKLCSSCEGDYRRSGEHECEKCKSVYLEIFAILGSLLAIVLYLVFLIKSSIRAAYSPKSTISIHLKILTNYIQIMTILSYFDFDWPETTLEQFRLQRAIFDSTDRVYSIDCLMSNNMNPFFIKLILVVIQPLIFPLVASIVWLLSNLRSKVEHLKEKILGSISIILFWIHPFIFKFCLSAFNCKEIEGSAWLYVDLEIECWEGDHMKYAMIFGLFGLVIWGLIVPAAWFFLLKRNREKLNQIETKLKYGFLYNGYQAKNYYWELFLVYRKVILVTCSVFLRWENQAVTVTIVHIIIFVYLAVESQVRPYLEEGYNKLDIMSLLAILATMYSAILYSTYYLDGVSIDLVISFVWIINLAFIIYWFLNAGHRILEIFYGRFAWFRRFTRKLPRHITSSFKFIQTQDDIVIIPLNENENENENEHELPNLESNIYQDQSDSDKPAKGSLTNEKSDTKRGSIEITLGNEANLPHILDQDSGDDLIIQPYNSILSPTQLESMIIPPVSSYE